MPRNPDSRKLKGKRVSPRAEMAARLHARGLSGREATKRAGFNSRHAHVGSTMAELKKDPRIRKIMADEMAKQMTALEVQNLLGAQARGEVPTKVSTNAKGRARATYDSGFAADRIARIHGLYKDTLSNIISGPEGGPIKAEIELYKLAIPDNGRAKP